MTDRIFEAPQEDIDLFLSGFTKWDILKQLYSKYNLIEIYKYNGKIMSEFLDQGGVGETIVRTSRTIYPRYSFVSEREPRPFTYFSYYTRDEDIIEMLENAHLKKDKPFLSRSLSATTKTGRRINALLGVQIPNIDLMKQKELDKRKEA